MVGWADISMEVINNGRMPHWHADAKFGHFANARQMPESDKQMLRDWIAAGLCSWTATRFDAAWSRSKNSSGIASCLLDALHGQPGCLLQMTLCNGGIDPGFENNFNRSAHREQRNHKFTHRNSAPFATSCWMLPFAFLPLASMGGARAIRQAVWRQPSECDSCDLCSSRLLLGTGERCLSSGSRTGAVLGGLTPCRSPGGLGERYGISHPSAIPVIWACLENCMATLLVQTATPRSYLRHATNFPVKTRLPGFFKFVDNLI